MSEKKKNKVYEVHPIDGIPTIITSVKGNIAKGYILKKDLTTVPTYVAKQGSLFAHGDTMEEAIESLRKKVLANMSTEERVEKFKSEFSKKDLNKKLKASEWAQWHSTLTGACETGVQHFMDERGVDTDKGYTLKEYFDHAKKQYGWDVVKDLAAYYLPKENWN